MNEIPERTRRDVFDLLSLRGSKWHGALDEVAFLGRLWQLKELPSKDPRYKTAEDDIWKHRIANEDWEDDWVLDDERFDLLHCPSDTFAKFLCETVHPVVRPDHEEASKLVRDYNEHLRLVGWEIVPGRAIAEKLTFVARVMTPEPRWHGAGDLAKDLLKRGFKLGAQIGSGSCGAVFKAEQASLDRIVAIKVFDRPDNEKLRKRFVHEAKLLARLQHPSIPYVVTTGKSGETPYTVMQYIAGRSVRQLLDERKRLGTEDTARILSAVLSALQTAHANDIVHRDVKPENILLSEDHHAYLIDFSIGASLKRVAGLTRVTAGDNVPGTMRYMAPEVLAGKDWDHRIDIYASGVVLFEMLTGGRWDAVGQNALASVDDRVANVIRKACSESFEVRFADCAEFARALESAAAHRSLRESPGTAVCASATCPTARWQPTFEPTLVEGSTDLHCRSCGGELVYQCPGCGWALDGVAAFCPVCGGEVYRVPCCRDCGVPLKRAELGQSLCAKCRGDDIPF
jgi:predicted Ser/Thr protein kinase